ncbi:hypothetical protein GCM10009103_54800 [Pseudomonas koreensis]|nr:hypothetical protein GCM10009103_54800 [Pseudomonas koreensis]
MLKSLPDEPELLKQMLAQMQSQVGFLYEENALLRQRLSGRKSEQTADSATPQLALFNEAESIAEPVGEPQKKRSSFQPSDAADASRCPPIYHVSKLSTNFPNMN